MIVDASGERAVIVARPSDTHAVRDSDASEATTFNGIVGAVRLPDGSLVLGDRSSRELRHFDRDGNFTDAWARRGRGPGEIESLTWIRAGTHDTVLVYDRALRRLSRFHDGSAVGQLDLNSVAKLSGPSDLVGVMRDGTLVFRVLIAQSRDPGITRSRDELVAFSDAGTPNSIVRIDGEELFTRISSSGGRILGTPPFQRRTLISVGASKIALADTESGAVRVVDPTGRVDLAFRFEDGERVIGESDIRVRLSALARERPPNRRAEWERLQREMIADQRLPAFSDIRLDERGAIWIRRYDRTQTNRQEWVVVSADGIRSETVRFPVGCEILQLSSREATCVSRDELGRESVQTFSVVEP